MEIDIEKFLTACAILIIFSCGCYLISILGNQEQLLKTQGYIIRNQKLRLNEKENLLEQEKNLDIDFDGDGLTLREEKKLRTFDTYADSDGDSVPDKYDEHPMGGGRMVVKHIKWSYLGKEWDIEFGIPSDIITYYEQIQRPRWNGNYSYFSEFVDDKGISEITSVLNNLINEHGEEWDYYKRVMFIVSMVRQIHYASDTLVGFDEFTKFPMQTLNDGTGDCEDISILAAAILKKMNYDVKLVYLDILNQMNHVAIAVFGEDYCGVSFEREGKKYYYIETIASYGFGEYPSKWVGGNVILIDVN